jgi:hypothetical protein
MPALELEESKGDSYPSAPAIIESTMGRAPHACRICFDGVGPLQLTNGTAFALRCRCGRAGICGRQSRAFATPAQRLPAAVLAHRCTGSAQAVMHVACAEVRRVRAVQCPTSNLRARARSMAHSQLERMRHSQKWYSVYRSLLCEVCQSEALGIPPHIQHYVRCAVYAMYSGCIAGDLHPIACISLMGRTRSDL